MKKQIATITLGIIMIASAMAMYAGETITIQTNLTNPAYTVYGNTSDLEGLTISFDPGIITIVSDPLMKPDNFTLIFFDEKTKEVIHTVYVGGGSSGGGSTKYIYKNETVEVPKYINTTIEIPVEKIVDNTQVVETGYKLWHIIFFGVLCLVFGAWVMNNWRKR